LFWLAAKNSLHLRPLRKKAVVFEDLVVKKLAEK
jgi:hypothetical protein